MRPVLIIRQLRPGLVLLVGLAAYLTCGDNPFVFDDKVQIVDNHRLRQLWPPTEILAESSRPVVEWTLAINYALDGLHPRGYHAVNVAIHLVAALLLYAVVRRTLESERLRHRWAGPAPWLAGTIAALWVAHPLQTASVTYVIQRSESLMGLFYLLTLYCVIRSQAAPRAAGWTALAMVACALGMATKEVMVTAPVVVLLYDRVFLSASWRELWQRRRGLHAGLAATWLVLAALMARWSPGTATVGFELPGLSPGTYALTQAGVILHYLRLAIWPDALCFDYGVGWPVAHSVAAAVPALCGVGCLLAVTAWAWWRQPTLGFVGAWFFLILAPTSSVVPVADVVFEHRMYLPLGAVATLVVLGCAALIQRLPPGWRRKGQDVGLVLGVATVGLLGTLTARRNLDYRSELAIWRDVVAKCPTNVRGHNNLALSLSAAGQHAEAVRWFAEALRINPHLATVHNNLGNSYLQLERPAEAKRHFEEAIQLKPGYAEAHHNLGLALQRLGQFPAAIRHYERALELNFDHLGLHNNLGNAYLHIGQPAKAIHHFEEARRLDPAQPGVHNNLGLLHQQSGQLTAAVADFNRALHCDPRYADAHFNLGNTLRQLGRVTEAIAHLEQAVRLNPADAEAHYQLGLALEAADRFTEAIPHFEQALRLNPHVGRTGP